MQAKYDQLTMKNRSERLVSQTEVSVKTNPRRRRGRKGAGHFRRRKLFGNGSFRKTDRGDGESHVFGLLRDAEGETERPSAARNSPQR